MRQILQNHAKSHVIFVNTGGEKLDSAATEQVIAAYYNTIERGFQQSGLPRFIISGKDQKMILGIGGNVSLRASYDFGGIADNLDFITADIPVPNTERYNQQFQLDPSTSGLFFKAIAHAGKLGPIVGYISANFRGYQTTGFSLRDAYITVAGFTVGRRFTTFCDLTAVPTTVDFEGPNGYTTLFNTMIRYTHTFNAHWQIAVAAEMPDASITTSAATGTTTQRMPDFPVYAQYRLEQRHEPRPGIGRIPRPGLLQRTVGQPRIAVRLRRAGQRRMAAGPQMDGLLAGNLRQRRRRLHPGHRRDGARPGSGHGRSRQAPGRRGRKLDRRPAIRIQQEVDGHGGLQRRQGSRAERLLPGRPLQPRALRLDQRVLQHHRQFQAGLSYMYGSRKNLDGQLGHANRIQALVQYNF
ncbi:MAG: DcaP family trimeric outer membrane transporter [Alistipes indistinctus]